MLQLCRVQGYVARIVQHLDSGQDPEGANNWDLTTHMPMS